MHTIQLIILSLALCTTTSCQTPLDSLHFLDGTWKIENKEHYEQWDVQGSGQINGYSYRIEDNTKHTLETITIQSIDGSIIYTAVVFNQNDGKAVPFTLNPEKKNVFSFENQNHDFPTQIIYQKIDEDQLFIQVLGKDDKGFSYRMMRNQ